LSRTIAKDCGSTRFTLVLYNYGRRTFERDSSEALAKAGRLGEASLSYQEPLPRAAPSEGDENDGKRTWLHSNVRPILNVCIENFPDHLWAE